jgi:hypothetical protein
LTDYFDIYCLNCNSSLSKRGDLECRSCSVIFAEPWSEKMYESHIYKISSGRNKNIRLFGDYVTVGMVAVLGGSLMLAPQIRNDADILNVFAVPFAAFCIWEVHCFFWGKKTHIDRYVYEARSPKNRFYRLVGLLLDLMLYALIIQAIWVPK